MKSLLNCNGEREGRKGLGTTMTCHCRRNRIHCSIAVIVGISAANRLAEQSSAIRNVAAVLGFKLLLVSRGLWTHDSGGSV
jgi:hypothetical protein